MDVSVDPIDGVASSESSCPDDKNCKILLLVCFRGRSEQWSVSCCQHS
jgi:hypothetical protein